MSGNHWLAIHRTWSRLRPPQRPHPDVIAATRSLLAEFSGRGLLLGVTPEYADILPDMTAVDRSRPMLDHIWPGDTPQRRAVQGDWLDYEAPAGSFDAVVGDGSANTLTYPDPVGRLFGRMAMLLRPGGRMVLRVYTTPEIGEALAALPQAVQDGRVPSIHGLKWRIAAALARQSGKANVAVTAIRDAFQAMFPDRGELAQSTGWVVEEIDTIDTYRGSQEVYCFPTRAEFLAVVPAAFAAARFVEAGTYDLASACPLLVMDRA